MLYRFFLGFTLVLVAPAWADAEPSGSDRGRSPWLAAGVGRTPAAAASGGTELEAEDTRIGMGLNLARSESGHVDIGIDYQYTRYEYVGIDSRDRDLHRLQIPVQFEADMGAWRIEGYVAPGVSTSSNVMKDLLEQATSDDFLLTGRLVATRELDKRTWIAGIAHDRRFGRSRAYPVVGVDFSPRENTRVRLAFPDPSITVGITGRQFVQARLYPAGHQWHVVSNDFSSDFDYRVEAWRGQLTWRVPIWRSLGIDVSAGYEFAREHRFTGDAGARLGIEVDDQWFASIGFLAGPAPFPATHGGGL